MSAAADEWAASLRRSGVPTAASRGRVYVKNLGEVVLVDPPDDAAARAFVSTQTTACRKQLLQRIASWIDLDDPRISASESKGRVRVRAAGNVVATITRWEIVGANIKPVREDVLVSDRPLAALVRAVERRVGSTRPTPPRAPSPALVAEVNHALAGRNGATRAELAEALGVEEQPVMRSLTRLIAERKVTREQRGSSVVYRIRDTQVPSARPAQLTEDAREALAKIVQFLRDGGLLDAHSTPDGHLRIGGEEVQPPDDALRDATKRLRWLDALVARCRPRHLLEAAQLHLDEFEVDAEQQYVAVLGPTGERLARLQATRARVRGAQPVEGNFLAAGQHWRQLATALASATDRKPQATTSQAAAVVEDEPPMPVVAASPPRERVAAGLHREMPDSAPDALRTEAASASLRLRTERTRVYDHPIRIDVHGRTLSFRPIAGLPLAVPFSYDGLDGAIRVTAPDLVLPCYWLQPSDAETFARAWTLALVAYAEITCIPARIAEPRRPSQALRVSVDRQRAKRSVTRAAPAGGLSDLPSAFRLRARLPA